MQADRTTRYWSLSVGFLAGVVATTIVWGFVFLTAPEDDRISAVGAISTSEASASDQGSAAGGLPVIPIEARDWVWEPSTISLTAGESVVLEITNTGDYPHGIWVPDLGINVSTPPGETISIEVTPETPGEYFLGCNNDLCGTEEQHTGMTGTIVVEVDPNADPGLAAASTTTSTAVPTTTTSPDQTTSTTVAPVEPSVPEVEMPTAAVVAVVDVIDTFGFHMITEEIENAGSLAAIDPGYLGKVDKAVIVAQMLTWPDDLEGPAADFLSDAIALSVSLGGGDLAGAREAAGGLHVTQHELSEATYTWLATQPGTASEAAAVVAVVDVIDTFGFHMITEEIENAGSLAAIDPGYLGKVDKAVIVAQMLTWPDDLEGPAADFLSDAIALSVSLGGGDLAGAREAAGGLHVTQHELSEATYTWLGG